VGEFLILIGAWTFSPALVAVASLGVILAAGYVLWMVKRVFYGELGNPRNQGLPDLSAREATVLVPLVVLAILMGVASPKVREATRPVQGAVAESAAAAPLLGGTR
jgi:NADH-quinone oxidoreductase subunit M